MLHQDVSVRFLSYFHCILCLIDLAMSLVRAYDSIVRSKCYLPPLVVQPLNLQVITSCIKAKTLLKDQPYDKANVQRKVFDTKA